jgi:exodeoxyribonuclease VII large subunit
VELFAEKRILTVTQLTRLVKGVLEENFAHVWVEGEVSNLASPSSGHLYFTLKDAGAQIRCVMFRASVKALRFRLADGMALVVRGRLTLYEQRGDYQLLVEYLEPKGIGALQLAFTQMKEKMAKEGLFAEERKRPLPQVPSCIGVVTSPTGAAIHDILTVLEHRGVPVSVLLAPVRVQGEGAAREIAQAIRDLNSCGGVDVIIAGRGGGSLEDLWAFNEEEVARAIAASRIPVVSAVGHEVDYSIADFVADLRAPTPSAAAEIVLRRKVELVGEVAERARSLETSCRRFIADSRRRASTLARSLRDPSLLLGYMGQRLDDLEARLAVSARTVTGRRRDALTSQVTRLRLRHPAVELERRRERLGIVSLRLSDSMGRALERQRDAFSHASAALHPLSPLATLGRGYSIVRRPDGRVVTDSRTLVLHDRLQLLFRHGGALCVVEDISPPGDAVEGDLPLTSPSRPL